MMGNTDTACILSFLLWHMYRHQPSETNRIRLSGVYIYAWKLLWFLPINYFDPLLRAKQLTQALDLMNLKWHDVRKLVSKQVVQQEINLTHLQSYSWTTADCIDFPRCVWHDEPFFDDFSVLSLSNKVSLRHCITVAQLFYFHEHVHLRSFHESQHLFHSCMGCFRNKTQRV